MQVLSTSSSAALRLDIEVRPISFPNASTRTGFLLLQDAPASPYQGRHWFFSFYATNVDMIRSKSEAKSLFMQKIKEFLLHRSFLWGKTETEPEPRVRTGFAVRVRVQACDVRTSSRWVSR